MNSRYRVVWAIDVTAESSLQATLEAYASLLRTDAEPVFDVYREETFVATIDLADLTATRNGNGPTSELDFDGLGDRIA